MPALLLEGIAFLTIIIAAITSTFIARAEAEREAAAADADRADGRIEAALGDLGARLDRAETMLSRLTEP